MIRKFFLILILFSLSLLASGCSTGGSPEEHMKPPRLSEDKEQVKQILKEYLPKNSKHIIPPTEGRPSSIKLVDLDGDGNEEAVVFYTLGVGDDPLRVLVLKKGGKGWISKGELKITGNDLDKVIFKDVVGDGGLDIIIGSKTNFFSEKNLSIYSFKNDNLYEIFENKYNDMVVDEFSGEKISEIVLLKTDEDNDSTLVELYKNEQQGMVLLDKEIIESLTISNSIKSGKVSNDRKGFIVNTNKDNNVANIYMFSIENNKIKNLLKSGSVQKDKVPNVDIPLPRDIDDDGILEFAIQNIENSSYTDDTNISWTTEWYVWDGKDSIVLKKVNYYDEKLNFSLDIPIEWKDSIKVSNSKKGITGITSEEWVKIGLSDNKGKFRNLFNIYIYTDERLEKIDEKKKEQDPAKILEDINKTFFLVLNKDNINKEDPDEVTKIEEIVNSFKIIKK